MAYFPPTLFAKKNGSSRDMLTNAFISLGSLLFTAIGLLVSYQQLPAWTLWIGCLYVVIVMIVLLHQPLQNFWKRISWYWAMRMISSQHAQLLRRTTAEMMRQLDWNPDTILYILQEEHSWLGSHLQSVDSEHTQALRSWLIGINKRLANVNRGNCPGVVEELGDLLNHFHRICLQIHRKINELIADGKVPPHRLRNLRQSWNSRRDKYSAMINEWQQAAKEMNTQTRIYHERRLTVDSFDVLPTLE